MQKNTLKNKFVILFGGPSSEREVSLGTSDFFLDMYSDYDTLTVEWKSDHMFNFSGQSIDEEAFLKKLIDNEYSVILASHGEYFEDGYIQEKLEKAGVRFTGSDSASCKLSMDKVKSQENVKNITKIIPTHRSYQDLKYPFIAKPNALGSSIGVYIVKNDSDLDKFSKFFNDDYIFQPLIKGRELSLGSVRDGSGFLKLYPTEIRPKKDFFDYEAKYVSGMSEEITPANLDLETTQCLVEMTNKIHNSLGLGYYSRTDYILSEDGDMFYLETNSLPGMTKTSLVPQQLSYSNLTNDFKQGLIKNMITV